MDGFDFLDEYLQLDEHLTSDGVIIMLTPCLNPYDMKKAMKYKVVRNFRNKPLTTEMQQEITDKHLQGKAAGHWPFADSLPALYQNWKQKPFPGARFK